MAEKTGLFMKRHLRKLQKSGKFNVYDDQLGVYVSPYLRTRQTLQGLLDGGLADYADETRIWESQYLTEMDWGLFEGEGWKQSETQRLPEYERNANKRAKKGKFYARCPNGESVKDVVTRVDLFAGRLQRRYLNSNYKCNTFVVVSHGVTVRALIMRWFHLTPGWYEQSTNHPNCSVYEICGGKNGFIFGGYGQDGKKLDIQRLNPRLPLQDSTRFTYEITKSRTGAASAEVSPRRSVYNKDSTTPWAGLRRASWPEYSPGDLSTFSR